MSHGSSNSLPGYVMERLRRHHDYHMKHWSLHDLRRTARTNFSAFTSRDVAQLMIGHVMSGNKVLMIITNICHNKPKHMQSGWIK